MQCLFNTLPWEIYINEAKAIGLTVFNLQITRDILHARQEADETGSTRDMRQEAQETGNRKQTRQEIGSRRDMRQEAHET